MWPWIASQSVAKSRFAIRDEWEDTESGAGAAGIAGAGVEGAAATGAPATRNITSFAVGSINRRATVPRTSAGIARVSTNWRKSFGSTAASGATGWPSSFSITSRRMPFAASAARHCCGTEKENPVVRGIVQV